MVGAPYNFPIRWSNPMGSCCGYNTPLILFPLYCCIFSLLVELEGSSWLRVYAKKSIVDAMRTTLGSAQVNIEGERKRPPPTPPSLTLPFVDESMLEFISCEDLVLYVIISHDSYYDLYWRCSTKDSHMVHILNFHLYMLNIDQQYQY